MLHLAKKLDYVRRRKSEISKVWNAVVPTKYAYKVCLLNEN